MAVTPEGKTKALIKRLLNKYPDVYRHMAVPYGYGGSTLDYILCVWGAFVAVDAKKPGGKLTKRQQLIARCIYRAGGLVFVIDGPGKELELFKAVLEGQNDACARARIYQAQTYWCTFDTEVGEPVSRSKKDPAERQRDPSHLTRPDRDRRAAPVGLRYPSPDPD